MQTQLECNQLLAAGLASAGGRVFMAPVGCTMASTIDDAFAAAIHPADLLTVQEEFGRLEGLALAYVGDGRNNMANSLLVGCAKVGMDVAIGAPAALQPDDSFLGPLHPGLVVGSHHHRGAGHLISAGQQGVGGDRRSRCDDTSQVLTACRDHLPGHCKR